MVNLTEKYRSVHYFVGGRCWHCGIKPDYLTDFIFACINGNITEEHLKSISPCHDKLILEVKQDE